jgi:hypothetical protein
MRTDGETKLRNQDQRRPPLPDHLSQAARDFYLELRRLVNAAGLSSRALEEVTSVPRTSSSEPLFYSKSQWGRWLNGQSQPPRKAIRRLAGRLAEDELEAEHLLELWGRAFASEYGPNDARESNAGESYEAGSRRPTADSAIIPITAPTSVIARLGGMPVGRVEYRRPVMQSRPVRLAPRPQFLVGREELLTELGCRLATESGLGPRTVVLCGLGGAGKTSLAVEYAYR